MDYEQKYKQALAWMASLYDGLHGKTKEEAEKFFPELTEVDELTWLISTIKEEIYRLLNSIRDEEDRRKLKNLKRSLAWLLEKQNELKTELVDEDEIEDEIYWLAWVIGRLPDTEQANEAEAVLKELLGKLGKIKARRQQ